MAYKKNNPKKKTNHTKIIPTKPKSNKGFKENNHSTPSETKIVLENRMIETKTWKQTTKNVMEMLLPLIILIFFSWVMFYKIMPRIGEDINNFIAGAKDNINKFYQETYNQFKNNAHNIKDNFYNRFKEWKCPDWLAKTGSIIVPLLIGGAIALCCFAIPVIGPILGKIAVLGTIGLGCFMLFTTKNTSTPPTPPREDVTVIDYDNNQQKDKEVNTKKPTKK